MIWQSQEDWGVTFKSVAVERSALVHRHELLIRLSWTTLAEKHVIQRYHLYFWYTISQSCEHVSTQAYILQTDDIRTSHTSNQTCSIYIGNTHTHNCYLRLTIRANLQGKQLGWSSPKCIIIRLLVSSKTKTLKLQLILYPSVSFSFHLHLINVSTFQTVLRLTQWKSGL